MVRVTFTRNLERHVSSPAGEVEGRTVAECLAAVFERNPALRDYVVDEHGGLRRHMTVFIGETLVKDRKTLSDPVPEGAELYVAQALSGG